MTASPIPVTLTSETDVMTNLLTDSFSGVTDNLIPFTNGMELQDAGSHSMCCIRITSSDSYHYWISFLSSVTIESVDSTVVTDRLMGLMASRKASDTKTVCDRKGISSSPGHPMSQDLRSTDCGYICEVLVRRPDSNRSSHIIMPNTHWVRLDLLCWNVYPISQNRRRWFVKDTYVYSCIRVFSSQ